jgi:nucleotide-binding universal stress UspA family protein
MFHKILVAIDLSKNSERVFTEALSLTQAVGCNLMLIHVLSNEEQEAPVLPMLPVTGDFPLNAIVYEDYHQKWLDYDAQGAKILQFYADRAIAAGINTEFTQNSGDPGHVICSIAHSWEADLIVVGRRGYSGWNELLLGSASNYVLHHAHCSILTVQGQPDVSEEKNVSSLHNAIE